MAKRPGGVMVQGTEATRSQLIPVMTKWTELGKTAQLGPVLFCIVVFFGMVTFGSLDTITYRIVAPGGKVYLDPRYWIYTSNFLIMLAVFLTMVSLYFIYRMIGKAKSWYILLGAAGFTAYYLWLFTVDHDFVWMYEFFHLHLAGGEADNNAPFIQIFIAHFLGTGFFEEIVKALPIFALVIADRWMTPEVRAKIGIQEPLDGILIGAASGGGFAVMETLCQYIPQDLVTTWTNTILGFRNITGGVNTEAAMNAMSFDQLNGLIQQGSSLLNTAPGIKWLIIRSIDESFGHMAYAGYFGYFIGLSVIKPEQRWKILLIGLVSASIPHALWDTVLTMDTVPLEAAIAVLSYAVLAAAVLKAREISPNRSLLQPSVIFGGPRPSAAYAAPAGSAGAAVYATTSPSAPAVAYPTPAATAPAVAYPAPASNATARIGLAADAAPPPAFSPANDAAGSSGNRLRVGTKFLVIVPGLRLLEHQVPGLLAQSPGGAVAEVTRNPNDPSVLGLTNLSSSAWVVVSNGSRRQIGPGQTIKLAPGAKIDFGSTDGEVG
jgi:RsiW-degrading membrane proteinase PrsW (M82 family)